jgi:hypothetical protein
LPFTGLNFFIDEMLNRLFKDQNKESGKGKVPYVYGASASESSASVIFKHVALSMAFVLGSYLIEVQVSKANRKEALKWTKEVKTDLIKNCLVTQGMLQDKARRF